MSESFDFADPAALCATTYEGDLRVFSAADDMVWVIARDVDDAAAVYVEETGYPLEDAPWTLCPPTGVFTWCDDNGRPVELTTYGELAKRGRGYLADAMY